MADEDQFTETNQVSEETQRSRSLLRCSGRAVLFCIATITLAGSVVRFTVQDRYLSSAIVFYVTPLPLLLLGASCCMLAAWFRRRWAAGVRWLVFCTLLGAIWFEEDWKFPGPPQPVSAVAGDDISVLFWNLARREDLSVAAAFIRERDPDIVGLVEVQGEISKWKKFWKEQLPHHEISALGSNMYLLTKGQSGESLPHSLGHGSEARQMQIRLHGRAYEVLLVDIFAHPLISRRPALQKLAEIAENFVQSPVVILGDFNTPKDSIHLQALRMHHQLAFEVAGRGYGPTWPIPLPLMQLDQIWTNEWLIPIRCRHNWTWASDHLPVEVMIRSVLVEDRVNVDLTHRTLSDGK